MIFKGTHSFPGGEAGSCRWSSLCPFFRPTIQWLLLSLPINIFFEHLPCVKDCSGFFRDCQACPQTWTLWGMNSVQGSMWAWPWKGLKVLCAWSEEESLQTGWIKDSFTESNSWAETWRTGLIWQQEKGSANYSLWAKSILSTCFRNKVVLEVSHAHSLMYCLWLLSRNGSRAE